MNSIDMKYERGGVLQSSLSSPSAGFMAVKIEVHVHTRGGFVDVCGQSRCTKCVTATLELHHRENVRLQTQRGIQRATD